MKRFHWKRKAAGVLAGLFLTGGTLFAATGPCAVTAPPTAESYTWDFRGEAAGLLEQVKARAATLSQDAATLESFKRSGVSWQSHAKQLNRIRGEVNETGKLLCRLQTIRRVTAPWQQQAIDRAVPVAAELASRTESAIEHLNAHAGRLFVPEYQEHVTAIADLASALNGQVGDFLSYADTQQKLDRIEQKLELNVS